MNDSGERFRTLTTGTEMTFLEYNIYIHDNLYSIVNKFARDIDSYSTCSYTLSSIVCVCVCVCVKLHRLKSKHLQQQMHHLNAGCAEQTVLD